MAYSAFEEILGKSSNFLGNYGKTNSDTSELVTPTTIDTSTSSEKDKLFSTKTFAEDLVAKVLDAAITSALDKPEEKKEETKEETKSHPPEKPSVICTELHRQGLLPGELYRFGQIIFQNSFSARMLRGYHLFGIPVAERMKKDPELCLKMLPLALAYYDWKLLGQRTLLGFILAKLGEPFCYILGCFIPTKSNKENTNGYLRT